MAELLISRQAEADLDDIWWYIAEDHIENANRYLRRLHDKAVMLSENTEIGTKRPELGARVRAFPVDHYVFYYIKQNNGIELVRVFHSSRDPLMLF